MLTACSKNNLQQVRTCILRGESPNTCNEEPYFEYGWPAIRYAALSGNKNDSEEQHSLMIENAKKIITLLLLSGADINYQDADGVTTLMSVAQFKRRLPLVQFMMKNGADKKIKDKLGQTAYDYANTKEIKKILEN